MSHTTRCGVALHQYQNLALNALQLYVHTCMSSNTATRTRGSVNKASKAFRWTWGQSGPILLSNLHLAKVTPPSACSMSSIKTVGGQGLQWTWATKAILRTFQPMLLANLGTCACRSPQCTLSHDLCHLREGHSRLPSSKSIYSMLPRPSFASTLHLLVTGCSLPSTL